MKIPRDLSGHELIQALCRIEVTASFIKKASHVVLETEELSHQRLSIPDHKILRIGTLAAILRAVAIHKKMERQAILDSL
jgi:hypothetical protein